MILAAGYGTRLTADLERSPSERWRGLTGVPKPLLPLAGVPLISRWLGLLSTEVERITTIVIVTNDKFYSQFVSWKERLEDGPVKEKVILYNDFSASNEGRVGAVRDLELAVRGDFQHSHWSSSCIAGLSLVESFTLLKYFHDITSLMH